MYFEDGSKCSENLLSRGPSCCVLAESRQVAADGSKERTEMRQFWLTPCLCLLLDLLQPLVGNTTSNSIPMHPTSAPLTDIDLPRINIIRKISQSDASSIFEVHLDGQKYAFKLFHENGDPGYAEDGRDLNRFRCEFNAYQKLLNSSACERNFVPKFYGYIDRGDPAAFHPFFQDFTREKLKPSAILLEYLPNAEQLNCVNYSDALYPQVIEGMREIHRVGVHHRDIYPRNMLLVRGNPYRMVWIDFDVAATTFTDFGPEQLAYCQHEIELIQGLGELLVRAPLLLYWKHLAS